MLLVATAFVAVAASLPTASLSFPAASLSFAKATVSFPTGSFGFPTSALSMPTALTRIESPQTIEVTLPADILFDFDKADIRAVAEPTLYELAGVIRDKARGPVTIKGYTDALGADGYNQKLSERRAAAVKSWLVAKERLAANALSTSGFGAREPVAPNKKPDGSDNPEGRQLNRRVTVLIRK